MFGHLKLVLDMLRVATKEFPDPHLPTENGGVIGLFEQDLLCIPGCPSIGSYGHHKGSSPPWYRLPVLYLTARPKNEPSQIESKGRCNADDYIIKCHVLNCFET